MARRAPVVLPAVSRYLLREFFGLLLPIVAGFIVLYLVVDFFDHVDVFIKYNATLDQAFRYFLFKVPLVISQIVPPAVLTGLILALGTLSQRNEIIALRASGVSLAQMALPLLVAAVLISATLLGWGETVVPYCSRQFAHVNNVEIRKREVKGLLSDREIWYHGTDGFYNIDYVDTRHKSLAGLTIYRTGPSMQLRSITQIGSARWTGDRWDTSEATVWTVGADGTIASTVLPPGQAVIHESLADFSEVQHDPDELSYLALRQRMQELKRKGIDASNYNVDLQMKLAVPFTAFVLACVAVPLAGRVRRHPSVAATLGSGIVVGFGYWVLLALTRSLGHAGALPPLVAAWAANAIYLLLGCGLFLSRE